MFKVSAVHVEAGLWLSSHVAASRGPPKYKQHADEQLSPFVLSLRLGRGGSGSMAATFARSYTVGFFPMRPSQGTGVSRRIDNTNGLSCSSACCLYFGGPRDAATCDDSHSTKCASLPRHARRTL
ncbi:hypothetical protein AVEN_161905-1 [Araneus ventricosus]|uniref:Uncharacterized protein n=1 Tax=Araneus ventricosus TaxID=182803 RepID=A0A4Y2QSH6_ARAVE|nr:hypothetical protein AVEN_161905-1 [Araneus ventricosus]